MTENELQIAALKELLLSKICADEKLNQERFDATAQALKLQAVEYERRLETLNHVSARLDKQQAESVTRELFDSELKHLMAEITQLKEFKIGEEAKATQKSVNIAYILIVIGLILSAVSFVR